MLEPSRITVEPLNKGHFGSRAIVLFSEVILCLEVHAKCDLHIYPFVAIDNMTVLKLKVDLKITIFFYSLLPSRLYVVCMYFQFDLEMNNTIAFVTNYHASLHHQWTTLQTCSIITVIYCRDKATKIHLKYCKQRG